MQLLITSAFLFSALAGLQAQALDRHNLFQIQLRNRTDGSWTTETPRFLNTFNRAGYNNQPKFFNNDELYLAAQLYGDTTQTEIVALNLQTQVMSRVTSTLATAEYSPTPMPGGRRFSAIRVEEDGTQHLWSFPLDRSDNGRREVERIRGVGYHCWLRDTMLALFMVGENDQPHTLQITGIHTQDPLKIASNPGRCLLKTAGGELAYVHKVAPENWYLKTWNPEKNTYTVVEKMPEKVEDFCLLSDGAFLCGKGAKLLIHQKDTPGWQEIADLTKYGVKNITRLDVNARGVLVAVVQ